MMLIFFVWSVNLKKYLFSFCHVRGGMAASGGSSEETVHLLAVVVDISEAFGKSLSAESPSQRVSHAHYWLTLWHVPYLVAEH